MNMFKSVAAHSVDEYLQLVPIDRQADFTFLHNFIQKHAPTLKPFFANNMIGYGSFTYTNYKKEVVEWPVIALASQKHHFSIYVCAINDGQYIAEKFKDTLGKVSVGKSCIRFTKLEHVNLKTLEQVIKSAVKHPGLVGVNQHSSKQS